MIGETLPLLIAYQKAWLAFEDFEGEQMNKAGSRVEASFLWSIELFVGLVGLAVLLAIASSGIALCGIFKWKPSPRTAPSSGSA